MASEAQTRKELIDKALIRAGWSPIVEYSKDAIYDHAVVTEYPTDSGPADYVLFDNGFPVAIVESKRLGLGPQNVLIQAQRYSRGFRGSPFNYNGYHTPFIYSTSGEVFWFQDLRDSGAVQEKLQPFTHLPH